MAGALRTNYFRVTDEEKYKKLFANLISDDDIFDFTETIDGVTWHGFASYSSIDYGVTVNDYYGYYDICEFYKELQKILPEDEAFILIESEYEKRRYATGWVIIVTAKEIRSVDIVPEAIKIAKEMLGNPNFSPIGVPYLRAVTIVPPNMDGV